MRTWVLLVLLAAVLIWLPLYGCNEPDLPESAHVTFVVENETGIPITLPAPPHGLWLQIETSGYSLRPSDQALGDEFCEGSPEDFGPFPPPEAMLEAGESFSFSWKANAFTGAEGTPGISTTNYCQKTAPVEHGVHTFSICSHRSDVRCDIGQLGTTRPPDVCTTVDVEIGDTDASVEVTFEMDRVSEYTCPEPDDQ